MATVNTPKALLNRLQVALADNALGRWLYSALQAALNYQPPTKWFRVAVKSDTTTGTADTWSWAAGGSFGRVHSQQAMTISNVHAHVEVAHDSGNMVLELWRNRGQQFGTGSNPGTMLKIASVTVAAGEADGAAISFTWVDDSYKELQAGDYLHMQCTTRPAGSGWATMVDVHYGETQT